ncbi:hypothetical protein C8R43DRAFT_1139310 [Mycena crocata]|nr:hypothetical protein C8R43DRAFT_1139310 [Mycena crocata]
MQHRSAVPMLAKSLQAGAKECMNIDFSLPETLFQSEVVARHSHLLQQPACPARDPNVSLRITAYYPHGSSSQVKCHVVPDRKGRPITVEKVLLTIHAMLHQRVEDLFKGVPTTPAVQKGRRDRLDDYNASLWPETTTTTDNPLRIDSLRGYVRFAGLRKPASSVDHEWRLRLEFDRFCGREHIARLSARFIIHLCPPPKPSPEDSKSRQPEPEELSETLAIFIARVLHNSQYCSNVVFGALYIYRGFISALMLSAKTLGDQSYKNYNWVLIGQRMFDLLEINQMERQLLEFLDWQLVLPVRELSIFRASMQRDFGCDSTSYPTYLEPAQILSEQVSSEPEVWKMTVSRDSITPSSAFENDSADFDELNLSMVDNIWNQPAGTRKPFNRVEPSGDCASSSLEVHVGEEELRAYLIYVAGVHQC